MYARLLSGAAAVILLSLAWIDGASAEGGCGPGFHRGPYGGFGKLGKLSEVARTRQTSAHDFCFR